MRAIFSLGYNYKAFDNGTASCLTIKSVKLLVYRYRYIPESELAEDNRNLLQEKSRQLKSVRLE